MSTSSLDPASTVKPSSRMHRHQGETMLRDRLADLADRSQDQHDFFERVTADLQSVFGAAIVILQSADWPRQMVHTNDATLLEQCDDEVLDLLLETATQTPICCVVPLVAASPIENPRALRVELTNSPQRVTAIIIHPRRHRPSAARQVDDLNRLQHYTETTRELVQRVPVRADRPVAVIHPAHVESPTRSESRHSENTRSERLGGEISQRRALSSFHHSLDLSQTCYRIANEARRMIGCDRVTVLVPKYSNYQVKSVSGVAVVDRRSNPIRAVECLARAAAILDRQLVMPSDETLPPQVQVPLDHYLDESGVSSAIMIPLMAPTSALGEGDESDRSASGNRRIQGILVLENFSGPLLRPSTSSIDTVASEAGIALRNALEHHAVFALPLWKMIGGLLSKSRTPIWIAVIGTAIALLAAGLTVPVEHHVIATGTVEPIARRDLFAAVDGSVQQLHVHDGQQVAQGELLIQLENPELENRAEALAGQIQTTAGRLASIQAVRLSNKDEAGQSSRLVLEERQLESDLANLRSQQEVLKLQLADLAVTSPIDGTVVAWQIDRRLMGRPVNRGNLLCTVANPDGSWKLRLTVPEQNAGPIVDEARQTGSLLVRFAVATMPERTFHASLDGLSYAARMDELGNRVIDLSATVDGDPLGPLDASFGGTSMRVGADVTAKIACGQRTLIQSWFSDVFDFVNRQILFRFR